MTTMTMVLVMIIKKSSVNKESPVVLFTLRWRKEMYRGVTGARKGACHRVTLCERQSGVETAQQAVDVVVIIGKG